MEVMEFNVDRYQMISFFSDCAGLGADKLVPYIQLDRAGLGTDKLVSYIQLDRAGLGTDKLMSYIYS